jgi:hypothetical protein
VGEEEVVLEDFTWKGEVIVLFIKERERDSGTVFSNKKLWFRELFLLLAFAYHFADRVGIF